MRRHFDKFLFSSADKVNNDALRSEGSTSRFVFLIVYESEQFLFQTQNYFMYYLKHEQHCFIRYRSRVSLGLIKHALRMFYIASKTIDLVSSLAK